jgi:exopolysaccharide production protein ExoZ
MLAATLLVSVTWQNFLFYLQSHGHSQLISGTNNYVLFYALPGRCFEFALGMAAAALVLEGKPSWRRIGLCAAIVAMPVAVWLSLISQMGPFRDQLWGIVFAGLLVALSGASPAEASRGYVRVPYLWLVAFGEASYSVYLVHEPLLRLAVPLARGDSRFAGIHAANIPLLIGWMVLLFAAGFAFHHFVEKPFMNRSRRAAAPSRLEQAPAKS